MFLPARLPYILPQPPDVRRPHWAFDEEMVPRLRLATSAHLCRLSLSCREGNFLSPRAPRGAGSSDRPETSSCGGVAFFVGLALARTWSHGEPSSAVALSYSSFLSLPVIPWCAGT